MILRRFQILAIATLVSGGISEAQEGGTDEVPPASVVQEKVREWVRAQKLRGGELADWQEQQRRLAMLNEVRREEIGQIDALIEAAGSRLEEATRQREELVAEQTALKAARARLAAGIGKLESALAARLASFPEALREKAQEAIARIENPDPDRPLQDRYRDIVAVTAAATDFSRALTVTRELRPVGGEQVEVEVLYAGLAAAWYVGRGGKVAGHGRAGVDGWTWTEDNGIADEVRTAIDMHRKERSPGYVELPFPEARGG